MDNKSQSNLPEYGNPINVNTPFNPIVNTPFNPIYQTRTYDYSAQLGELINQLAGIRKALETIVSRM